MRSSITSPTSSIKRYRIQVFVVAMKSNYYQTVHFPTSPVTLIYRLANPQDKDYRIAWYFEKHLHYYHYCDIRYGVLCLDGLRYTRTLYNYICYNKTTVHKTIRLKFPYKFKVLQAVVLSPSKYYSLRERVSKSFTRHTEDWEYKVEVFLR